MDIQEHIQKLSVGDKAWYALPVFTVYLFDTREHGP